MPSQAHKPKVTINMNPETGAFFAEMDEVDAKIHARELDQIEWTIHEPPGFPPEGVAFVQFFERDGDDRKVNVPGCLVGGDANNGRQNGKKKNANNHRITQFISSGTMRPERSYEYLIGYRDEDGDHPLLDPEIVVEGSDPTPFAHPGGGPKGGPKPAGLKAKRAARKAKKGGRKTAAARKGGGRKAARKSSARKKGGTAKKTRKARKAKKR